MTTPRRAAGRRHAGRRGQALVEFALVLPTVLLVIFVLVQLILLVRAAGAVQDLARQVAGQVALAGAETPGVDAALARWASDAGLAPSRLVVQVTTTGSGQDAQPGDAHAAGTLPAHPAPAGAYAAEVSVALRYTYLTGLPFVGQRTFVLPARATAPSLTFGQQGSPQP